MKFTDILNEGINDKNIFKAVFIAGGPGSGKSFVTRNMFGSTLKVVNSDDILETKLKQLKLPLKLDPAKAKTFAKQTEVRDRAKKLTKLKQMLFVDGMLPIVIDGTGKEYDKIKKQKEALEQVGYDTYMVFVNTSLDTAMARNEKRARTVPEKIVKDSWKAVQGNMGKFQSLFGSNNFKIVDQNKPIEKDSPEFAKWATGLHRVSMKFLDGQIHNKVGQDTVEILKAIGGKTLSDLSNFKL